jgi:predicted phosphodiesterase
MTHSTQTPKTWSFVHLSDIHFRTRDVTGEDREHREVRDQLLADLALIKGDGQQVDAILVSGDVAFSGQTDQYDTARGFLDKVCNTVEIASTEVWMIPGNHDINRESIKDMLKPWQKNMKQATLGWEGRQRELDRVLTLRTDEPQDYFLNSYKEYNAFAGKYGCESKLDPFLYWRTPVGTLDHDVIIQVTGLNSAFLCNDTDVPGPTVMIGKQQHLLPNQTDTVSIVMCHHPETWLADGGPLMQNLRNRSHIALFGHEHRADVVAHTNLLILHAGAVNPEETNRNPPAYNIVTLWLEDGGHLRTEVRRRYYNWEHQRFMAHQFSEGNIVFAHSQPISFTPKASEKTKPEQHGGETRTVTEINRTLTIRRLTFYLLDLNEGARISVGTRLNLFTPAMAKLDGRDLYYAVIDEADARNQLLELWHEVAKHHRKMPAEPDSEVRDG